MVCAGAAGIRAGFTAAGDHERTNPAGIIELYAAMGKIDHCGGNGGAPGMGGEREPGESLLFLNGRAWWDCRDRKRRCGDFREFR